MSGPSSLFVLHPEGRSEGACFHQGHRTVRRLLEILHPKNVCAPCPTSTPIGRVLTFICRGFWRGAMAESKAGNFSFWLGKNHVVGVSGEAARKMYLDDRSLHLIKGITLIGHGPDFIDGRSTVIHDIWKSTGSSGRTYAQRRLLDLQRNDQLTKRLPRVTEDARKAFQALSDAPSNVINPSKICYRVVVQQGARIVGSDTIADRIPLAVLLQCVLLEAQVRTMGRYQHCEAHRRQAHGSRRSSCGRRVANLDKCWRQ
jgi:hypothetical protein